MKHPFGFLDRVTRTTNQEHGLHEVHSMKCVRWSGLAILSLLTSFLIGCALFGPSPEEELREVAAGTDHEEKREVLQELEPTPEMFPTLAGMLSREPDPAVRAMAAEAIGTLQWPKAVDELRKAVKKDPHWIVRQRALAALGNTIDGEIEQDLAYVLENDADHRVRVEAVRLAEEWLPPETAFDTLLTALQDDSDAVRLQAARALEGITDQSLPPRYEPWKEYLSVESGSGE